MSQNVAAFVLSVISDLSTLPVSSSQSANTRVVFKLGARQNITDFMTINKISIGKMTLTFSLYFNFNINILLQWRIQDFPEEGVPTPRGGGANIQFCQNFPKTA